METLDKNSKLNNSPNEISFWSDFDIHPNLKKKKSKTNTLPKK